MIIHSHVRWDKNVRPTISAQTDQLSPPARAFWTSGELVGVLPPPFDVCTNSHSVDLVLRFGDEDKRDREVHPCKGLFQTCCSVKADEPLIPKIDRKEGCGHRNSEGVGFRITGDRDNESQYGEFPWMVAIIKEEQSLQTILNVYQCGGSIIHPLVCAAGA